MPSELISFSSGWSITNSASMPRSMPRYGRSSSMSKGLKVLGLIERGLLRLGAAICLLKFASVLEGAMWGIGVAAVATSETSSTFV